MMLAMKTHGRRRRRHGVASVATTDAHEIATVLGLSKQENSSLLLHIPGVLGSYRASICSVSEDSALIALSPFTPDFDFALHGANRNCTVSGAVHGVDISFTATFAEPSHVEGELFCFAEFPHHILYRQSRRERRVSCLPEMELDCCSMVSFLLLLATS